MASKLQDFVVSLDSHGKSIGVLYKGKEVYQTRMGAFLTLCSYALMLFNTATLIEAYYGMSKQTTSQATKVQDMFEAGPYNLQKHKFEFIIPYETLPSNIGRFVLHTERLKNVVRANGSNTISSVLEEVPLVECSNKI